MKITPDFDIREFVAQRVYDELGAAFCLRFVNPVILRFVTWLKAELTEKYGEEVNIRMNDWHYGGSFHNRVYRDPKSTVGKWTSVHRLALAVDMSFEINSSKKVIPVKDVYQFLLSRESEVLAIGITRLEDIRDTPTWLHADGAYTGKNAIQIVRP